jgi:hypothetical protein
MAQKLASAALELWSKGYKAHGMQRTSTTLVLVNNLQNLRRFATV